MPEKVKEILITDDLVINKICLVRGNKVMLDKDLAELYGTSTKTLKQSVRRNIERFPADFMFELTTEEFESLRSQFVTSKPGRGGTRYLPMAFTEQGVAMLSSVLKSETAIGVNIQIIRVFTRMRQVLMVHKDILQQLEKAEQKLAAHDADIVLIFKYLKQLLQPPASPRNTIGFKTKAG